MLRTDSPFPDVLRKTSEVALRIAALDERLDDQNWRTLTVGRKELLLPLRTDRRFREGARHVARFDLTHAAIRRYVAHVLRAVGRTQDERLTVPTLVARVRRLRETLEGSVVLARIAEARRTVGAAERATTAAEVEALRALLARIAEALRKTS